MPSGRVLDRIRHGSTFRPDDDHQSSADLLRAVYQVRLESLVVFRLALSAKVLDNGAIALPVEHIDTLLQMPSEQMQRVLAYPPFLIWLRKAVKTAPTNQDCASDRVPQLVRVLDDLPGIINEATDRTRGACVRLSDDIELFRYDVHPYLAEAAPPTYEFRFPSGGDSDRSRVSAAYPLDFFAEVIETALRRLEQSWPAARYQVPAFVRTIVHVPDGEFRSASAARYTGTIFLTAGDWTLLDAEESLLHEFGHQVLYHIMEVDPIIADEDPDPGYVLPWSGAERDFYGFFHAFYIYILLAHYYRRFVPSTADEGKRARRRLEDIVAGLSEAIALADQPERYTDHGAVLARSMQAEAKTLLGIRVSDRLAATSLR